MRFFPSSMLPVPFFSHWLPWPISILAYHLHGHSRIQGSLSLQAGCGLNVAQPILCLFSHSCLQEPLCFIFNIPSYFPYHLSVTPQMQWSFPWHLLSSWPALMLPSLQLLGLQCAVVTPYAVPIHPWAPCLFRSLRLLSDLPSFRVVMPCIDRLVSNIFHRPLPLPAHPLLTSSTYPMFQPGLTHAVLSLLHGLPHALGPLVGAQLLDPRHPTPSFWLFAITLCAVCSLILSTNLSCPGCWVPLPHLPHSS